MSEESLKGLLERIESDEELRTQLAEDPAAAMAGLDLSATEATALLTNDEDGLRRLAGVETAAFAMAGGPFRPGCGLHMTDVIGNDGRCEVVVTKLAGGTAAMGGGAAAMGGGAAGAAGIA